MPDRARLVTIREHEPIRSHAHAAATLPDAPFVAYALVQAFKLFIALVGKRWPNVR